MKRFSNVRSIAIFWPISEKVFGYPENINLRGDGCRDWCEWVSNDWEQKCLRGLNEAPCMASVSPEMVREAADKFLRGRKKFSYPVEENRTTENKMADHIVSKIPIERSKLLMFPREMIDPLLKLQGKILMMLPFST
jgi:hypothetical protein